MKLGFVALMMVAMFALSGCGEKPKFHTVDCTFGDKKITMSVAYVDIDTGSERIYYRDLRDNNNAVTYNRCVGNNLYLPDIVIEQLMETDFPHDAGVFTLKDEEIKQYFGESALKLKYNITEDIVVQGHKEPTFQTKNLMCSLAPYNIHFNNVEARVISYKEQAYRITMPDGNSFDITRCLVK